MLVKVVIDVVKCSCVLVLCVGVVVIGCLISVLVLWLGSL